MLSIETEKKIRDLLNLPELLTNGTISRKAGVSRKIVQRIRNMLRIVDKFELDKASQIRKLLLQGVAVKSIAQAVLVPVVGVVAIQRYYYLQTRESEKAINRCPTCDAMMFGENFKEKHGAIRRKSGKLLLPEIDKKQAGNLYRLVVDMSELNKLCIIANPVFYYLARRAEKVLEEINGDS